MQSGFMVTLRWIRCTPSWQPGSPVCPSCCVPKAGWRIAPRSQAKLLAKKAALNALSNLVDATLSIGSHNRAYWNAYFGAKVPDFQMPYAVENAFFRQRSDEAAPTREALRSQLGLEVGHPVILFASKLQPRKHCDHLLEAYLQLRSDGGADPEAYLIIVGDGEERSALESRVAASGCQMVRFAGFRNQRELPGFFDLCTVFVLPSRHEPWGLTVNEAMNAARPVIVSDDVGCAPDLVFPGKTGWVYPTGNVSGLRDALAGALHHPARTAEMGRAAREHIATWDYEADILGLRAALAHTTRKIRP